MTSTVLASSPHALGACLIEMVWCGIGLQAQAQTTAGTIERLSSARQQHCDVQAAASQLRKTSREPSCWLTCHSKRTRSLAELQTLLVPVRCLAATSHDPNLPRCACRASAGEYGQHWPKTEQLMNENSKPAAWKSKTCCGCMLQEMDACTQPNLPAGSVLQENAGRQTRDDAATFLQAR